MKQMLVAGGASHGRYGDAMEIYSNIRKASPRTADGMFQRLALATKAIIEAPILPGWLHQQIKAITIGVLDGTQENIG
jgi:hypothetical protein